MSDMQPKENGNNLPLSVVMPVYNSEKFVRASIGSILSQSFQDFEFIIIDDGSEDSSREIIRNYRDPRIRFFENEQNNGVSRTLNKGFALARGRYIARMDADDISVPQRFSRQINYLEKTSEVDVCGSWVWRTNGKKKYILRYPVGKNCVSSFLLFGNPLAHPTVMLRRDVFRNLQLEYKPDCKAAQDYELWSRCWQKCKLENISEPLVEWRQNPTSVTSSRFDLSNEVSLNILERMLRKLDICIDKEKLLFHREVGNGGGRKSLEELQEVSRWLTYLLDANQQKRIFSDEGLHQAAAFVWYRVCLNSSGLGLKVVKQYLQSSLRKWYKPGRDEILYFLINALIKFNKLPTGRISPARYQV